MNNLILVENLLLRENRCDTMEKIVFSYFLRDDPIAKERQPSLPSFYLLQLRKNLT
jgi:hypothetical protein